ncbi:hypothetical protein SGPA1_50296 [Streptomyces misionensis JCM 4497]
MEGGRHRGRHRGRRGGQLAGGPWGYGSPGRRDARKARTGGRARAYRAGRDLRSGGGVAAPERVLLRSGRVVPGRLRSQVRVIAVILSEKRGLLAAAVRRWPRRTGRRRP